VSECILNGASAQLGYTLVTLQCHSRWGMLENTRQKTN